MVHENYLWLAGLIAAHPGGKIVGRTRLQKEVKLLQSLGFPTDYSYTIHFYGPYSEGLHADIGLLEMLGCVREEEQISHSGTPYFIIEACDTTMAADVSSFGEAVSLMSDADSVILELAATYNAFRESGANHDRAIRRLKRKKGKKCEEGREDLALELLRDLGLDAE